MRREPIDLAGGTRAVESSARGRATRAHVLDTARRLFVERGVDATSVEDICSAAYLSRGAFYHHFASKEEVLAAIGTADGPTIQDRFTLLLAGDAPTAEVLATTIELFARGVGAAPAGTGPAILLEMIRAWTADPPAPSGLRRNVDAVVARGAQRGDLPARWAHDDLTSVLVGIILGALVEWLAAGTDDPDDLVHAAVRRALTVLTDRDRPGG